VDLLELAQKRLVLGEFFEPRLTRPLEHPDGVVARAVPKIVIEMTKEAARGRLPGPPKVKRDLSQRLERRRQSWNYVIDLERRHEQKRRSWRKIGGSASFYRAGA